MYLLVLNVTKQIDFKEDSVYILVVIYSVRKNGIWALNFFDDVTIYELNFVQSYSVNYQRVGSLWLKGKGFACNRIQH